MDQLLTYFVLWFLRDNYFFKKKTKKTSKDIFHQDNLPYATIFCFRSNSR